MIEYIPLILKGFTIGFLVSTPVTPIGILCFRRFMRYGPRIGFFSGLGSATADFIISIVAGFGLSFIVHIINVHEVYIRLGGSIFFILLGLYVLFTPPQIVAYTKASKNLLRSYFSILFLTLSNPGTIPSFAALFAGLGVGAISNTSHIFILATSITLGSTAWWALLAGIVTFAKQRLRYETLKKINTVCGIIILVFGIFTLLRMLQILW